uniref:GH16 domain-containing protein n=1 Tax=Oryza brachyantha TaxID=4533 RepID=J3M1Q0_ORYBR
MASRAVEVAALVLCAVWAAAAAGKFDDVVEPSWANDHVVYEGDLLKLRLDSASGGGFASKSKFLYGKASADLKLVPGDSAGVVTAFYVTVVRRGQAQRVRLRVPGQRHRRAVPGADEPLHRRRRQPGAAHRPVVRPHHRLPHLRRPVEPQPGRLPRRRHPDPRLREQERHHHRRQGPPPPRQWHRQQQRHVLRAAVPVAAADVGVQLHLERGRLGDARRARQDGLVARAVRGHVPRRAGGGLRVGGQRQRLGRRRGGAVHGELVGQGGEVLVEGEGHGGAHRAPEPPARLGARPPPRLRLLRRYRPLPRPAAGVRRPVIADRVPMGGSSWMELLVSWFANGR